MRFIALVAAIKRLRQAEKSFVHPFWFLFVDVMQGDSFEAIEAKEQVQLGE